MADNPMARPAALLILCLFLSVPARADIDGAIAAYDEKDYAAALAGFTELADRGIVLAMTSLAYMYAHGEGTEADPQAAARWLDEAARLGNGAAQIALGAMHFHGEGVEKNLPTAYAWFNVAATNGRDDGLEYMQLLLDRMDDDTRKTAMRLARRLFDQYGDKDIQGLLKRPGESE